jgi:hypothetical protein
MTRRDALLRLSALFGGTIFGAHRLLAGAAPVSATLPLVVFSTDELALLNEVAETILPATAGSGGAKAADIATFMQEVARDYYEAEERELLLSAPARLNEASGARYGGRGVMALSPDERYELLLELERAEPSPDYYRMVKQLTVWGYWTSEVGVTQALNYLPVPGMYQGCITVAPDTKAWSG